MRIRTTDRIRTATLGVGVAAATLIAAGAVSAQVYSGAAAYAQPAYPPSYDTQQAPQTSEPAQLDPRYQDPRYADPAYQAYQQPDPRYQDPRYADPRYRAWLARYYRQYYNQAYGQGHDGGYRQPAYALPGRPLPPRPPEPAASTVPPTAAISAATPVKVVAIEAAPSPAAHLPHRLIEAAQAYAVYVKKASAIDAAFKSGASVAEAVRTGSAYEARQFDEGAIAYAALTALQEPSFVQGARQLLREGDRGGDLRPSSSPFRRRR